MFDQRTENYCIGIHESYDAANGTSSTAATADVRIL